MKRLHYSTSAFLLRGWYLTQVQLFVLLSVLKFVVKKPNAQTVHFS